MKRWTQTLQATVELMSEMVDREWRTLEEWQAHSEVPRPLFAQLGQWLETFAGQPLFQPWGEHRDAQRLLARQVREELYVLLAELEPTQAMAVLCSLPTAQEKGYSQDRLALLLAVEATHMQEWEQLGFERLREVVSTRTPLLFFMAQCIAELGAELERVHLVEQTAERGFELMSADVGGLAGVGHEAFDADRVDDDCKMREVRPVRKGEMAALLQAARQNPYFDLRQHVTPALEVAIRQAFHLHGVEKQAQVRTLFANVDVSVVQLVAERMKLEMSGGREERADG